MNALEESMVCPDLVQDAKDRFLQQFGRGPVWGAAAPGRVNLIGEHIDYNDGFVLPMAIDRFTVAMAAPREDEAWRIVSTEGGEVVHIPLGPRIERGREAWANYVRGVLDGFQRVGLAAAGADVLVHSSVPTGGGLSSSAALEVAVGTLVEAMVGRSLDPVEKALVCQRAEHDFAGVPCGIMDQFTASLARRDHLLLIDCRSAEATHVPFEGEEVTVLIANTNVQHELADGEYRKRREECQAALEALGAASYRDVTPEALEASRGRLEWLPFHRAKHVVGETARTAAFAAAVIAGEWERAGELLYESHASLRDDYEVSCPELDVVVAIAREIGREGGVYGCRMTGGGFGGSTVSLVATDRVEAVAGRILREYVSRTGVEATVFTSRPAHGARVLPV